MTDDTVGSTAAAKRRRLSGGASSGTLVSQEDAGVSVGAPVAGARTRRMPRTRQLLLLAGQEERAKQRADQIAQYTAPLITTPTPSLTSESKQRSTRAPPSRFFSTLPTPVLEKIVQHESALRGRIAADAATADLCEVATNRGSRCQRTFWFVSSQGAVESKSLPSADPTLRLDCSRWCVSMADRFNLAQWMRALVKPPTPPRAWFSVLWDRVVREPLPVRMVVLEFRVLSGDAADDAKHDRRIVIAAAADGDAIVTVSSSTPEIKQLGATFAFVPFHQTAYRDWTSNKVLDRLAGLLQEAPFEARISLVVDAGDTVAFPPLGQSTIAPVGFTEPYFGPLSRWRLCSAERWEILDPRRFGLTRLGFEFGDEMSAWFTSAARPVIAYGNAEEPLTYVRRSGLVNLAHLAFECPLESRIGNPEQVSIRAHFRDFARFLQAAELQRVADEYRGALDDIVRAEEEYLFERPLETIDLPTVRSVNEGRAWTFKHMDDSPLHMTLMIPQPLHLAARYTSPTDEEVDAAAAASGPENKQARETLAMIAREALASSPVMSLVAAAVEAADAGDGVKAQELVAAVRSIWQQQHDRKLQQVIDEMQADEDWKLQQPDEQLADDDFGEQEQEAKEQAKEQGDTIMSLGLEPSPLDPPTPRTDDYYDEGTW